jgi:HEAT repeat protein
MLAQSRPGDAGLGQLLNDSLFSGRHDEASYAANVLGRIGTEGARQALVSALSGKDKELASVAAAALGQLGMTDSVKTALLSAAQASPDVKQQVMNQLLQAGAPEGLRFAEELLNGKDPSSASSAVWALASAGTPEARQLIERALDAKDAGVRITAISSLVQNPDEKSTETLVRLGPGRPGPRDGALDARPDRLRARATGDLRGDTQRQARGPHGRDLRPVIDRRSEGERAARAVDARSRRQRRPDRDRLIV